MSNIKDKALEYLGCELSVIPTKEDKRPALHSWSPYQSKRMTAEEVDSYFTGATVKGLGIISGAVSGGLEVIDIDCKYDTTGSLWDEFRGYIEDSLPEIYKSLVIAQTKSGGYHIYYKHSQAGGNIKLANRPTTPQEREDTYKAEIEKGATEDEAKRRSVNDKVRVLIETRGEGGYVIAPPTTGYRYLQGGPGKIATITPEQRSILFNIAKSFNQLQEERPVVTASANNYQPSANSPFEDYNQRGDVVALLESKGWRVVSQRGERINLLRPGSTDSKTSGNFHTGLRTFRSWSTSTEFSSDKAYSASQVFSLLECNGDNKLAYRRLLEQGYGEPYSGYKPAPTQVKTELIKVEAVNRVNKESSVISTPGDSLKVENVNTATREEILITSPGPEATAEVLKAIELLQATGKKIFVVEGGEERRSYVYQLREILFRYSDKEIEQEEGFILSDRDKSYLLDEIVELSEKINNPLDRDCYKKEAVRLLQRSIAEISEESLAIVMDRLTATRAKEAQAKELNKLLTEATALKDKGDIEGAIKKLDKLNDVKLKDKATEFNSLLLPIKEAELKRRQANKPESLNSGYIIEREDLLLPSGAISVFTAPTSHGKTSLLINLALNVAQSLPDKETYLFTYEEDEDTVLMNTLNTYLNIELSANNRRSIKSYFATGSTEYIRAGKVEEFLEGKDRFFKELVDTRRLNINYSCYNSDTIIEAIRYLHKTTKKVGAVFIDYIQLLNLPEGKYKTYSRQEEIKEICIALKDIAIETGLPIILGAQFNREVKNPLALHPTNIGEAGDIERIANLIVAFWNDNFKHIATDNEIKKIAQELGGQIPGTLYTTILKQRGSRVGLSERLRFNGNTGKIENSIVNGF